MPDIASEIGPGDNGLEDSKDNPIFDSWAPSIKDGEPWYNLELER